MRVLRGHSNMNRIRRVMMPIVLRASAPALLSSGGFREPILPTGAFAESLDTDAHAARTRDVLVQPRNNFVSLGSMIRNAHMAVPTDMQNSSLGSLPPLVIGPAEPTGSPLIETDYLLNSGSLGIQPRPLPPVRGRTGAGENSNASRGSASSQRALDVSSRAHPALAWAN